MISRRALVVLGVLVVGCGGTSMSVDYAGDGGSVQDAFAGGDVVESGPFGTGGSAGQAGGEDANVVDAVDAAGGSGGVGGTGAATGGSGGSRGTGGVAGSGGTGSAGSGGAGGSGGDNVMGCPQDPGLNYTACGYPGAYTAMGYAWNSRKMSGLTCGVCTYPGATPSAPKRMRTGCAVDRTVDAPGITDGILCVSSCTMCCFDQPNTLCDSNADCCSPLTCQDNGAGKNKTCK